MSIYTYRLTEIKYEDIVSSVWKKKELDELKPTVGDVYKVNSPENDEYPYYKFMGYKEDGITKNWEGQHSVTYHWEPVFWFTPSQKVFSKNYMWCNNGGEIRDTFIGRSWGEDEYGIKERGFPSDMSSEIREYLNEYGKDTYSHTWVLLSEWENIFDMEAEKFLAKVKSKFKDDKLDEINEKIETIISLIKEETITKKKKKKSEEFEYYEDTLEYLFEEEIWKLYSIREEISKIRFLSEEIMNNFKEENVRIIYYLA